MSFKTIATALASICFVAAVAKANLANFGSSDRIALGIPQASNLSASAIKGDFEDVSVFSVPVAIYVDLHTQLGAALFLEERIDVIPLESINVLSGVGTTKSIVPEPSSLISMLISGCGVLLGLQWLRRRRSS
jgi:hypothetical protein